MNKIKVMFLVSSYNIGGFEKKLSNLAENMNRKIFELTVLLVYPFYKARDNFIMIREKHRKFFLWNGVETIELEMKNRYQISVIGKVVNIMRENRPDVLCFIALGSGTFLGPIAGKIAKVPFIVRLNDTILKGLYPNILKPLDKMLLSVTDQVIVPSVFLKNLLVQELRINPEKINVIPNGIDISHFSSSGQKESVKLELGLPEMSHVVGIIANFSPVKAHKVLLHAVPIILKFFPDTYFLLIGDGPLKHELMDLSNKLGISNNVKFLGYRADVNRLISSFDVGILCSKIEVHPISLIEMMASKVPIVAPTVGGIPEMVIHRENGLLVSQGDSDALAEAIMKLLGDKKLATDFGKMGKKIAIEKFSHRQMVGAIEEVFIQGLKKNEQQRYYKNIQ